MDAWSSEGVNNPSSVCPILKVLMQIGDRVQWFRAEAEMQRWQKQGEQKLVGLLRTMRSFRKMQSVWAQLAENQPTDQRGRIAYARQKAAMYDRRRLEARSLVKAGGYGHLLEDTANVVSFVEEQREKERLLIKSSVDNAN